MHLSHARFISYPVHTFHPRQSSLFIDEIELLISKLKAQAASAAAIGSASQVQLFGETSICLMVK